MKRCTDFAQEVMKRYIRILRPGIWIGLGYRVFAVHLVLIQCSRVLNVELQVPLRSCASPNLDQHLVFERLRISASIRGLWSSGLFLV
jgi:hypothetical protein